MFSASASRFPVFHRTGGFFMNMKKLVLVLLIGGVLQAAVAQDTASPEAESEDSLDFVVTAGRTREETAKVSAQVVVITAEDIAESGATSVVELLAKVPGIRLARDETGAGINISMRGYSSDAGRANVLVLIDGMRINPSNSRGLTNWDAVNLSEIDRIEVLDGGASIQYGDNAKAGVINIITKQSREATTDITVSGGSFFQNEQRFSHSRPTDWGGFTISGGHRGTQGYQKHTAADTGNGELRGIWDINDTMSLNGNIGFAFTNAEYPGSYGLTKEQFDDDPTQNSGVIPGSGMPDAGSNDNGSNMDLNAGLAFSWAVSEALMFDMPLSYNWNQTRYIAYLSGGIMELAPHTLGARPKLSVELRPTDMGLRLIGGVDMFFSIDKIKVSTDFVKESNPMVFDMSQFTVGPYALMNFEPFPFLSVNAGVRYDADFLHAKGDTAAVDYSENFDAFVYEAGLTLNPLDFLKVYAKYGSQFRYPYLDDLVNPYQGGTLNTGLEPETGWTAEGGVGLNFKGIAKLDANFYYSKVENEIFYDPATWSRINMDPIDRMGTNIGLSLTPVKYVELEADYGFVNAVFAEGNYKGKTVPLMTQHTLSASLILHAPFGLSLGPNVLYKSEFYPGLDYRNDHRVDSSMIWGLQARYARDISNGELALVVTVHNLADTKYASMAYLYDMSAMMPGLPPFVGYYVDNSMGRSVNVSIQYRF
jgi:iron complex outermembrane receptor protein